MHKKIINICSLIFVLFFSAIQSYAQTPVYYATFGLGFGARALSIGGAFIAIADDITAINYNPAGLAQLLKSEFSLGMRYGGQNYEDLGFTITDPYQREVHDPYIAAYKRFIWDYIGGVVPIRVANMPLVFGISQSVKGSDKAQYSYLYHYAAFDMPEDSINVESYQHLKVNNRGSITVTSFSLAIRPLEFLYLGYNINLWHEDSLLEYTNRDEFISYTPYNESSTGSFQSVYIERFNHGVSYDFGILLKFRYLSAGLIYRTSFKADIFEGDGSSEWRGILSWPYSYGVGVSIRPSEALTLSADYNFANWSEGRVLFNDGSQSGYPAYSPCDTKQIRFGAEYLVTKRAPVIPVRLGFFSNRVFWNDWRDKPIRFKGITCGTGLALKRLTIDFGTIYNFGSYNDVMYANDVPFLMPIKESNWEMLLSISYRLMQ